MKIRMKRYLHSSKDSNCCDLEDVAEKLGITISDKALHNFCYALYEVEFELEVDTETGEYTILSVKDGKKVLT